MKFSDIYIVRSRSAPLVIPESFAPKVGYQVTNNYLVKITRKIPNFIFFKILKNKWYHTKVLPKRFHLNGHTIGFRPQS